MASAQFVSPWGFSIRIPDSPHTVVSSGARHVIVRSAAGNFYPLALVGDVTYNSVFSSLSEAQAWVDGKKLYAAPAVVVPAQPSLPSPAYITVRSVPAGADIYIDSGSTGKKTNARVEVSPGTHNVGVSLSGYNSMVQLKDAVAGSTKFAEFTLSPITAAPAPAPAPTPAPSPVPSYDWKNLVADTTAFWGNWISGNIVERDRAANRIYEGHLSKLAPEEINRVKEELAINGLIVLVAGGLIKLAGIAFPATSPADLTNATAGTIRAQAATSPAAVKAWFKALSPQEAGAVLDTLGTTTTGRSAADAIIRIVAPAGLLAKGTALKVGLLGLVGMAITWLAFEEIDIIPGLRKSGALPTEPLDKLQQLSFDTSGLVKRMESVKFSCDQAGYNAVIAEIPVINKRFDELVEYARANPLNADQAKALVQVAASKLGIGIPPSSTAMYDMIVSAKDTFNRNIEIEKTAVQVKCVFGAEEAAAVAAQGVPGEVPAGKVRLQVIVYNKATNTRLKVPLLVDGVLQTYTLDAYNLDLTPESHELVFEEEGWTRYTDIIDLSDKKPKAINVFMEETPAPEVPTPEAPPTPTEEEKPKEGRVQITANVKAEIWVAGIDTGLTTPRVITSLPGSVDITLKAEGYVEQTKTAYVRTDQPYTLAFMLKSTEEGPAAQKVWRVDFVSEPPSAKISVNYAFTGKYTPDYIYLYPGNYIFHITKGGYKPYAEERLLEEIESA